MLAGEIWARRGSGVLRVGYATLWEIAVDYSILRGLHKISLPLLKLEIRHVDRAGWDIVLSLSDWPP